LWLFLLAAVVAGAISYSIERRNPRLYATTARLIVGPGIDSPSPDLNDLRAGGQLMQTYAELPETTPFLSTVISQLNLNLTPAQLDDMITVYTNTDTQLLSIDVVTTDPGLATAIANTVAETLVRYSPSGGETAAGTLHQQIQRQADEIEASIPVVSERIEELEVAIAETEDVETQQVLAEQLFAERERLDEYRGTLTGLFETLQRAATNQVKIIEPARPPTQIASRLWLAVAIGVLAGLTFSALLVFGYEYLTDSVDTADEMSEAMGVPTLGTLARSKPLPGPLHERMVVRIQPASAAAEEYRTAAIKLLFARQTGQPLRSILLTSVEEGQDIGEIAANLAIVLAQTGSRVVLVDGNMQRPTIGQHFGFLDRCGLTDVLRGACTAADPTAVHWAPGLFVLPSGALAENAFTLLASPRMVDVLEELQARVDIVLITSSPLSSSADSLFLAPRVDGVILVAQSRQARRRVLRSAIASLQAVGASIVGGLLQEGGRPTRRVARGRQPDVVRDLGDTIPMRPQGEEAIQTEHAEGGRSLDPLFPSR
jgi:capsular exopolysaccharide synthesis family protein